MCIYQKKLLWGRFHVYSFIYIHATIVSSFKRIEEYTDDIFIYDRFRIVGLVIICKFEQRVQTFDFMIIMITVAIIFKNTHN